MPNFRKSRIPSFEIGEYVGQYGFRGRLAGPQQSAQMGREGSRRGIVEDDGGGQPEPGGRGEPVTEFDGGERVKSEVPEGGVGLDRLGAIVSEHHGGLSPDELQDGFLPPGLV